ncbi:MAG: DUF72 domain-containing protein [Anaerolineales bacterium]
MAVHVGTSGWVYPHWRGVFYPPSLSQRAWFAHYAMTFRTVEINNSFYRLPSTANFEAWREQAPPAFVYAIKASRFITHIRRLRDVQEPLERFLAAAHALGQALGPVLYQLPPNWHVDLVRFCGFLRLLPSGYTHVVEFRDPSWFTEEVFALMEEKGVVHCLHDYWSAVPPLRLTAPVVYIRMHGDQLHAGNYRASVLRTWADRIQGWSLEGRTVHMFFNNDMGGAAIENALAEREMIRSHGVACD